MLAACSCLPAGCYRSTSIPVSNLERIEPGADGSLRVSLRGIEQQTFESYDTLEVETVDDTGYEFESPVRAELRGQVLFVSDTGATRSFAIDEVEDLELSESAPERPWIVAGVAAGSMLIGGVIGAAVAQCAGDFCTTEQAAATFLSGTLGLGLGFAISIPATSTLRPIRPPKSDRKGRFGR